jgi:hypothetical protein
MDDFERQLKQALERKDAPPWLEARILNAAAAEPAPRPRRSWTGLWWTRWATAALAVMLLVSGVAWQREREERAAGREAKAQLELALKITRAKLGKIESKLQSFEQRD